MRDQGVSALWRGNFANCLRVSAQFLNRCLHTSEMEITRAAASSPLLPPRRCCLLATAASPPLPPRLPDVIHCFHLCCSSHRLPYGRCNDTDTHIDRATQSHSSCTQPQWPCDPYTHTWFVRYFQLTHSDSHSSMHSRCATMLSSPYALQFDIIHLSPVHLSPVCPPLWIDRR